MGTYKQACRQRAGQEGFRIRVQSFLGSREFRVLGYWRFMGTCK